MSVADRTGDWAPVALHGPAHHLPGRLLTIEGSDGSGKSTFVSWLLDALGDTVPCTHVLMPGEHLRSYFYWRAWSDESLGVDRSRNDYTGLAMMAVGDRLVRQRAVVEPALEQGHLVICERYALTPLVFKADASFTEPLRGLFRPDLGILFDAPTDTMVERVAARPGDAVRTRSREEKDTEVQRFRALAASNGYLVVDTSTTHEYSELEPIVHELCRDLEKGQDPHV